MLSSFFSIDSEPNKTSLWVFVPCNLRSTGYGKWWQLLTVWDDGKSRTTDTLRYNINWLGWHVIYKDWYAIDWKRWYNRNGNLGIVQMNIDTTCTFNGNYHTTHIKINMPWKSFRIVCKNFSTSQTMMIPNTSKLACSIWKNWDKSLKHGMQQVISNLVWHTLNLAYHTCIAYIDITNFYQQAPY